MTENGMKEEAHPLSTAEKAKVRGEGATGAGRTRGFTNLIKTVDIKEEIAFKGNFNNTTRNKNTHKKTELPLYL